MATMAFSVVAAALMGRTSSYGQLLGFGLLTGVTYAVLSRPECGYDGPLLCW